MERQHPQVENDDANSESDTKSTSDGEEFEIPIHDNENKWLKIEQIILQAAEEKKKIDDAAWKLCQRVIFGK